MARRRNRVYLAVVGVGAVALAVDRCVLSSGAPEPNLASSSVPTAITPPPDGPPASADLSLVIPELPFPRNVQAFASPLPIRDVFLPPESVWKEPSPESAADNQGPGSGRTQRAGPLKSADFRESHRLEGVVRSDQTQVAVVDGAWLRVGQAVDGCTLIEVSGNEARFQCHDGECVLAVARPGALTRD